MSTLTIRIPAASSPLLVTLAGELDTCSAPCLRHSLLAVPVHHDLVLDVSGVQFLDAAALRVLLELQQRVHRAGAGMVVASAPRAVQRIVALAGGDHDLTMSPTVDGAFALLAERTCGATAAAGRATTVADG